MKKTLIAISFLIVGALGLWVGIEKPQPPFGAGTITLIDMGQAQNYYHVFKKISDGSKLYVKITETEYKALGLKDAGPAIPPDGYVWDKSFGTVTPDQDNYYRMTDKEVHIKIAGRNLVVPKSKYTITNNGGKLSISPSLDGVSIQNGRATITKTNFDLSVTASQ